MKLIEFNEKLSAKEGYTEVNVSRITEEDIELFKSLLVINDNFKKAFEDTNSATIFFTQAPFIKEIVGNKIAVEVFYACKAGFYFEGVPAKLTYELSEVFKLYPDGLPNAAILSCKNSLQSYLLKTFNGNTLLDIIENIYGKPFKLIINGVFKVRNGDFTELYVPNVDRVAIIPNDIAESISFEDCADISYEKDLGVCVKGMPIRRFGRRLGVTKDEFDLREVI